ncbi:MAG: RNA polymerase sporulation sigma factor SigH [Lachnospiraceae bacterium]
MTIYKADSDKEAVHSSQNGNMKAMEYLLEKYSPLVKKKSRKMYLMGGEQEDIIQEGMIGLYKAIRSYDVENEQGSFQGFADMCITRQIYTAITTSNRQKHRPLNEYVSFYEPLYQNEEETKPLLLDLLLDQEITTNPEKILLDKEEKHMLESIIVERLSSFESKVLALYLEGKKYSEISEVLNTTTKRVDNAIQRIRRKLMNLKR